MILIALAAEHHAAARHVAVAATISYQPGQQPQTHDSGMQWLITGTDRWTHG